MKLHDFIQAQSAPDAQKLRDLGKALTTPYAPRVTEVVKIQKPTITPASDDVQSAVDILAGDHKMVKNKIKNYD